MKKLKTKAASKAWDIETQGLAVCPLNIEY
jgi:hypothetical protein